MHIILNTKTYAINVFIPTIYCLKQRAAGDNKSVTYDTVHIKPGYNRYDDATWERLIEDRKFKMLLDSPGIFTDEAKNKTEFVRYDAEVKDILQNNEEYKASVEVRKAAESESKLKDVVRLNEVQKRQISELEKRLMKLEKSANGSNASEHTS